MIRSLCVVMVCLPLILACGPQGPGPAADVIEEVSVDPGSARVPVGQTIELDAVVTVASGTPTTDVTWSSSNDALATVDAAGVVSGVSVGTAIITATSVFDAAASGSAEIGVDPVSIAATADAAGAFSVLLAALSEAGLDTTFADDEAGPFTVFAPTDDAFTDLLAFLDATPEELLERDDLLDILQYHVVAGAFLAAQILDLIDAGDGASTSRPSAATPSPPLSTAPASSSTATSSSTPSTSSPATASSTSSTVCSCRPT